MIHGGRLAHNIHSLRMKLVEAGSLLSVSVRQKFLSPFMGAYSPNYNGNFFLPFWSYDVSLYVF